MSRRNNGNSGTDAWPFGYAGAQIVGRSFVQLPAVTGTMRGPDAVQEISRVQRALDTPMQMNSSERERQYIAKALAKPLSKMRGGSVTAESVRLRKIMLPQLHAAQMALARYDLIELNAICSRIVEELETSDDYLKQLNGE